jgi:hypothetical protein
VGRLSEREVRVALAWRAPARFAAAWTYFALIKVKA